MKNYLLTTSISLLLILLASAGVIWVTSSLWFMWELLPLKGASTFAIKHNTLIDTFIERYEIPTFDLSFYPYANRFVYSKGNNGESIVVLPNLRGQINLKNLLENKGWLVERKGLLLTAYKGDALKHSKSLSSISRGYLSRVVSSEFPANPLFIMDFKKDSFSYIDRDIFGVGSVEEQSINIQIAFNGSLLPEIIQDENEHTLGGYKNRLSLYIPTNNLFVISDDVRNRWNSFFLDKTGFVHTKPDITEMLFGQRHFLLSIQDEQLTMGVEGNPEDFIEAMVSAITKEETYTRPETQSFRLPDGSLGYEIVPGEPREIFNENDNCMDTNDISTKLWLCLRNDRVVISTDQNQAVDVLNEHTGTLWNVELGANFLEMLQIEGIKYLKAKGNSSYAIINLVPNFEDSSK